jgi:hypothetical protein
MKYGKEIIALTSLMLISTSLYAAPTNEQLYQMILDLKKEASESKAREKDLHANLDKAQAELGAAKEQLGALPKTEAIVTAVNQLNEPKQLEVPKITTAKQGFSVSAGALYVKPVTNLSNSNTSFEPGFQVATSYQALNNWDYALKFKHFTSSNINNNDSYSSSSSSWSGSTYSYTSTYPIGYTSNYNVLDLEVGKLLSLSNTVGLRLSGGIRSAIISESENSTYDSQIQSNQFWGIGPRITASPTWKPFANNFRVIANFGTGLLVGQYNSQYSLNFSDSYYSTSNNHNNFVTTLEAGTGIGYTIKANLVDIDLQTGYQLERWLGPLMFSGYHGAYGTVAIKY